MRFSLVLIDDEESIREGIRLALDAEYDIRAFAAAEDALEAVRTDPPDLILLDIGLPGMNGIEALRRIRQTHPEQLVIMITAYEDVNTVIAAMKLGAHDYVVKPILMDGLEITIQNALESVRLRKEVRLLQERYLQENLPCFVAESDRIQGVMEFISRVAMSPDTPILILGETGTGKELIAGAIHYRSPNFKGPFVTVNCAAIPKDLIESELFGYEKGAFSGAGPTGKRGLIEEADHGTLFLDEVGDLSAQAQAKLLRFLESGEFYRVGSTARRTIRTRIVSATNRNLSRMMEEGTFRRDLFFRLGVITVDVPSLSERKEDIIPLANTFLVMFGRKFGKTFTAISPEAGEALKAHAFTGNVRELRNLIERGVLIGSGPELTVEDLGIGKDSPRNEEAHAAAPDRPVIPPEGVDFDELEKDFERRYIEEALRMAGGNESGAARLLRMNHHTFRYRKKKVEG
ncbi:MAG TPA: sigma-54 dependent transcriptional regulator [Deltaproteobacteria bacterium]|nr:sigma-54 dependent transcriptional regulator [Deltaproteobacteria bacterium]HXK46506.1 sigma-54 dependent transcriptional regulator [Deltaproteobacteria bacterium]